MAPRNILTRIEELNIEQGEPHQVVQEGKSLEVRFGKLGNEVFKYDCLDRRLKRHHVTGKCSLASHNDCSLKFDRNCFFGCRWYRSLSDFGTNHSLVRSRRCFDSISLRRSYDLRGYAVARRDGQCKAGLWSDHGLS